MEILLVFPKAKYGPAEKKKDIDIVKNIFGEALSLTLPQVAAATPKKHRVTIVDENYEKLNFRKDIDIVGITCLTMLVPRAYEIADKFRAMDVPVILGGIHATALPKEAKQHADSVVVGEAETTWPQLLKDFEKGQLKPYYISKKQIPPGSIPEPRKNLLKRKWHYDAILIRRGCPNRCEFCTITNLYSQGKKPLKNVLKEIQGISAKNIFIYDSNISWDTDYTKQLFLELKKFDKRWSAFADIHILGENEVLLKLAKEAGFFNWFIGLESLSQKSLNGANKSRYKVEKYASAIKRIKNQGMVIVGSFVFGFDEDTPDIFDNTLEAINEWGINAAEFNILTPYPGTALYKRLKKEGRILTEDWRKYNFANVVFEPKNMSVEELSKGTKKVIKKFYSVSNILKRYIDTLETTNDLFVSNYILQRNFCSRLRDKKQFNI